MNKNYLFSIFVKKIQKSGKKNKAKNILLEALKLIENKENTLGLNVLEKAIKNTTVPVNLIKKKLGGSVYLIPIPISYAKSIPIAISTLINFAKKKENLNLKNSLAIEIIDAYKKKGKSYLKKQETIKQALQNRIFYNWMILKNKSNKNKISVKNLILNKYI